MTMGERQLKFLEFVPLILYFTFARAATTDSGGRQWEIAFVFSGVLSVVTLSVLMRHKTYILNRIMLGANLFLISGAVAVLLRLSPLLDFYKRIDPAPFVRLGTCRGNCHQPVQPPRVCRLS